MTNLKAFLVNLRKNTWGVLKDRILKRQKIWRATSLYLIKRKGILSIWLTRSASTTRSISWSTWKMEITTLYRIGNIFRIMNTWLILIKGASGMIDIYNTLMRETYLLQLWFMMMSVIILKAKVPWKKAINLSLSHHLKAFIANKTKKCWN